MTNQKPCPCGADDYNARNLSEGDRRVPHALNCPKHPNANAPKPPEAPKVCRKVPHDNPRGGYMHGEDEDGPYEVDGVLYCGRCHSWFENCERIKAQPPSGLPKPAPAPEPDPLTGIDAQRWAQEFMRIWAGRWSEVDESLMVAWFANAIMRGFDEGQSRLRRELQSANPVPAPEPKCRTHCRPERGIHTSGCPRRSAPEPKQICGECEDPWPCGVATGEITGDALVLRHHPCSGPPVSITEPKQGSEELIENERDCKHGRLKRKCDECDMEREIAALRAENEKLKAHALVFPADLITERDALRAELAQARDEIAAIKRQAEDATEYVLAVDNRELRREIEGLRIRVGEYEDMTEINKRFSEIEAELASAREEIARLSEIIEQRDVDWATERAARERAEFDAGSLKEQNNILGECYKRAEARVKKLEDMMIEASGGVDGKIDALVLGVNPTGIEARIRAEGRAILARAKEGEKR